MHKHYTSLHGRVALLRDILKKLAEGAVSLDEAEQALKVLAVEKVSELARLDVGREVRHGVPEVIIAEGKRPEDVVTIALEAVAKEGRVIVSRTDEKTVGALRKRVDKHGLYYESSGVSTAIIRKRGFTRKATGGKVGVMTAGTSDIPVAEEAKAMASEMGCTVTTYYDVGAAGVHRLFQPLKDMVKKEDHSIKESGGSSNPASVNTQVKIRWDSSGSRSAYANRFNVIARREEIILCFGLNQALEAGQKEVTVQLSNGIVLSPFTAKRLATVLDRVLRDYESKYGLLKVVAPPSTDSDKIASLSEKPLLSEKAGLLFHLVKDLNTEYGFERSFKITEKRLLGNRFLFTMSKHAIRQNPHEAILNVCRRMDMPKKLREVFKENLPSANYVHFGFEEDEKSYIYKAYLEFWTDWENEIRKKSNPSDPFLVHLGFKWDVSEPTRCVLTRYTCYPFLSVENVLERLSTIFYGNRYRTPFEIAKGIVTLASTRISH